MSVFLVTLTEHVPMHQPKTVTVALVANDLGRAHEALTDMFGDYSLECISMVAETAVVATDREARRL